MNKEQSRIIFQVDGSPAGLLSQLSIKVKPHMKDNQAILHTFHL